MKAACCALLALALGWVVPLAAAPLQLGIRGHQLQLPLFSVFASPAEMLHITHAYTGDSLAVTLDGETTGRQDATGLHLQAPAQPGLYELRLRRRDNGDETLLKLWVSTPREQVSDGKLNGYEIGPYPPPRSKRPNYEPPPGFIEVTRENIDTRLSPHFTLRQFLCKQQSEYPKYVVIQESLLLLLEGLLLDVRAAGFAVDSFGIISGYRTPWYNRKIGNVRYSRHVYGDAMDIFIDVDGNGRMDDLNNDGMHNQKDIDRFFQIVDNFKARPENASLVGGVGHYNKTSRHGGFVHIDTRGYRARW
ncbi:MAG: D-Ala-D-Ala carboxypeptidase family metallohydrolase [Halieaceae bacterium]